MEKKIQKQCLCTKEMYKMHETFSYDTCEYNKVHKAAHKFNQIIVGKADHVDFNNNCCIFGRFCFSYCQFAFQLVPEIH